jgi:hypothetical protein
MTDDPNNEALTLSQRRRLLEAQVDPTHVCGTCKHAAARHYLPGVKSGRRGMIPPWVCLIDVKAQRGKRPCLWDWWEEAERSPAEGRGTKKRGDA